MILDWDAPQASGVTGYRVYRIYRSGNSAYAITRRVTLPTYSDIIPAGRTHFYFVTAMYGTLESAPSNMIEVK